MKGSGSQGRFKMKAHQGPNNTPFYIAMLAFPTGF